MKLLIITGAPATGKTTIFETFVENSDVIGISKDTFKELMFDSMGKVDLDLSKKLGIASYNLLFNLIENFASSDKNIIVEANFRPRFDEVTLRELVKKYDIDVLQILCEASPETVLTRLKDRKNNGARHDNHFDIGRDEEFKKQILDGDYRLFDLDGAKKIILNTDRFLEEEIKNAQDLAIRFLNSQ